MKKISCLTLLLCLAMVMQLLCLPVYATEGATEAPTEVTLPVMDESAGLSVPEVAFGTASVLNGCRTLDAQMALGGNDLILNTAQAAFVYELNTGTMLYSLNPDNVLSPGALTKILTAVVALENSTMDELVTVSTASHSTLPAGARNSRLKNGEVLTMGDLLHCLILDLSNDAALAIAEHVAGSEGEFVNLMNAKANALGCTNTVFTNCHGIDSAGQYSTARDITRIIQYAVKNSRFVELFGTEEYVVPATEKSDIRELTTLNYLLEQFNVTKFIDDRVTGGIATYTSSSGASLACTAEENGLSLVIVVLGCQRVYTSRGIVDTYGNYEEVWDILAYSFENFKICRLLHDGQSMRQFTVANGENEVVGQTTTAMDAVLPINANYKNLILKYNVAGGGLTAPIAQGQSIATLQVWYRSSCIAETELYAMSSIRALDNLNLDIQGATRDDSDLNILSFLGIVCLVLIVPLAIYLTVNHARRVIARNRRRRSRRNSRRSRRYDGLG